MFQKLPEKDVPLWDLQKDFRLVQPWLCNKQISKTVTRARRIY